MNDSSRENSEYERLSDQQFHLVDALCDRFDRDLVNDLSPRIEAILAEAPEAVHEELLAELLGKS